METIKVNKDDLIKKVKQNRDAHASNYDLACKEFKEAVQVVVAEALAKSEKEREEDIANFEHLRPIYFDIDPPVSYLEKYDELLEMLDMSNDNVIELTNNQFRQYVLDKWEWKEKELTKRIFYAANSVGIRN